jgi:prepilin-type N-terminal cleavage/methylation domain-containing protein/prepilin-type processing-associated H-X9-DG protein
MGNIYLWTTLALASKLSFASSKFGEKKVGENMKAKKGFTLVELLVVISIIAMLLAVLLPSLNKAREAARAIVSRTHEKQITLAASLWSNERDGYVVAGMWDVPAKDPGDGSIGEEARNAIARGASLEKYTAARDTTKGSLYSCPTAIAKFGKDFFYSRKDISGMISGRGDGYEGATCYGVNSFAVMYTGDVKYLGSKGEAGATANGGLYDDWGPNNTYMLEHGKSKLSQIQQPSSKVYFMDFSYMIVYDWLYDPFKVVYRATNGTGESAYAKKNTLAEALATGKPIVQSRWHGSCDKKTGYGYGNMGWFDGSVSSEPAGYANPKVQGRDKENDLIYVWQQYFYLRH